MPMNVKIVMDPYPPQGWVEAVVRGIDQHNVAATGLSDYYPATFFVRDANREVRGGLLGDIWARWVSINNLWVDPSLRGKGYGAQLMARAEAYAIRKTCTNAFLKTGSYEARPFYEKLGYRVYAELENHPTAPHGRYFMTKALSKDAEPKQRINDLEITMEPYAPAELHNVVKLAIGDHALGALGLPERTRFPFNFFLIDTDGEVVGGALGNYAGDWAYLSFLWVDRQMRGNGHARQLVGAMEAHVTSRGCTDAFLGTFSFQARPLYEKLGYHVFGELKDYPQGHSHYLLRKRLSQSF